MSIGTKICAASPSSERIGGDTPSCTPSIAGDVVGERLHVGELGLGQLAVAGDDDDGGDAVVAEEVGQPLVHLRRVGALGQEGRAVVRRDLVDLAEVRSADGSADQPDQHEQGRDADPQPAGRLAVRVARRSTYR